jgi:NAD(P)-dependent dehydrogenase (short-subunit alcohol dehydrogenase family)
LVTLSWAYQPRLKFRLRFAPLPVAAVRDEGGKAFAVQAELSTLSGVRLLLDRLDCDLAERKGNNHFDILINNAAAEFRIQELETWADTGWFAQKQTSLPVCRELNNAAD